MQQVDTRLVTPEAVVLQFETAGIGSRFPLPLLDSARPAVHPESVMIDATDAERLEVTSFPANLEINNLRAHVRTPPPDS